MSWRLVVTGSLAGLDVGLLFAIWLMGGIGEEGGDVFAFYGTVGLFLGMGAGGIAAMWEPTDGARLVPPWLMVCVPALVGLNLGLVVAIRPADGGVSAESLPIYLACAVVGLLVGLAVGFAGRVRAGVRRG